MDNLSSKEKPTYPERKYTNLQAALEKIVRTDQIQENDDIYDGLENGTLSFQEAKERHKILMVKIGSIDHMTGLDNARAANFKITELMGYCEKNNLPLLGIYFDGDNFKAVNTKMGHDKGDIVIKILGEALQRATRRTDLQVRFKEEQEPSNKPLEENAGEKTESRQGGDEFFIALPGATFQNALVIFSRLNKELETLTREKLPEYIETFRKPITISAGIAQFDGKTDTSAESFIKRCERATNSGKDNRKGLLTVSHPSGIFAPISIGKTSLLTSTHK